MKRLAYFLFLAGAAALVSIRGGSISYLLFYFALMLPVLALIYSLYVYFRFKIVQEVERVVVKAQKVPYRLLLANEDPIPFTNISLNYFSDMVTIKETADGEEEGKKGGTRNLCLLSRQKLQVDTEMYCKYRGTYPVGVKSVSVTDFLGLFTITYPMKDQIRLTARPRIVPLEQLAVNLKQIDPKNNLFSMSSMQDLPDYELRQYHPGDTPKYIHWKNSARAGELLVRKQMPEELFEIVILIDLFPVKGDTEKRLKTEDTVIEAALSFVHHYYMKKIPVRVVSMQQEIQEVLVDAGTGFQGFYNICAELSFQAKFPLEQVWMEYKKKSIKKRAMILITASVTDSLLLELEESRRVDKEIVLIDTEGLNL